MTGTHGKPMRTRYAYCTWCGEKMGRQVEGEPALMERLIHVKRHPIRRKLFGLWPRPRWGPWTDGDPDPN